MLDQRLHAQGQGRPSGVDTGCEKMDKKPCALFKGKPCPVDLGATYHGDEIIGGPALTLSVEFDHVGSGFRYRVSARQRCIGIVESNDRIGLTKQLGSVTFRNPQKIRHHRHG